MPFVSRKSITVLAIGMVAAILAVGAFIWSGVYDVGADDPHWRSTHALLQWVRQRSIAAHAAKLQVPADLASPARIRQGAGNYAAMCTECHLAPGMPDTETKRGLYPAPPALAKQRIDPAQAFWVIKHGIKASGMPAWGRSMDDEYIWNLAAFVQALPTLDAAHYQALVESSEGHSHGGGEAHAHGDADEHDMVAPMPPADAPAPSTDEHDAHPHAH